MFTSSQPNQRLPCLLQAALPAQIHIYAYINNSYFRTFLTLFHAQGILNEQNGSGDMTKLYGWIDLSKSSMYQDDTYVKRELLPMVLNPLALSWSLNE